MPDTVAVSLSPDRDSARAARRAVTAALASWGWDDLVDDAALLVSELVTNAVLHARTAVELVVSRAGGRLRIEVRDHSGVPPSVRRFSPTAATGRGLQLVGSIAAAWGVESDDDGKVVWFELVARPAMSGGPS